MLKYLKLYNNYKISYICEKYNIKNWSINSEGLVDVDGVVNLSYKELYKLPLKFGKVTGYFDCSNNNLTSLEGVPKEVGGSFVCGYSKLTSLEGSPNYVGGNFYCNNNKLTSLEGGPKNVGGDFECTNNKLTSFEGSPDFIGGDFYCPYNPISSIWKLFKDYSKIELFNYYDIIRELDGKPAIVLSRLNQFLEDIGKQPVKKIEGYINI